MIVNEIAKFENPLHDRWSVLRVAELGEPPFVVGLLLLLDRLGHADLR